MPISAAHAAGVRRFVVSQPQSEGAPDSSDVLVVPDVLKAMQSMARTQRDAFTGPCAGGDGEQWKNHRQRMDRFPPPRADCRPSQPPQPQQPTRRSAERVGPRRPPRHRLDRGRTEPPRRHGPSGSVRGPHRRRVDPFGRGASREFSRRGPPRQGKVHVVSRLHKGVHAGVFERRMRTSPPLPGRDLGLQCPC